MAVTRLSDLVFGENFNGYTIERSIRRNAFVSAGVVVVDPAITAFMSDQGFLVNMPHFKRVANDEPNASSDDPAAIAVPKKIGTGNEIARKLMRNQGWSSADLTAALIAQDPMQVIGDQVGDYWAGVNQTTVLKIAQGILADNIANDNGDMLKTVATDATGAPTDAELFGQDVMLEAEQTMGDAKGSLTAIAVHSVIHTRMRKAGALLDFFDPETGRLDYQTFDGKRVIVDDDMPVTQGTNRRTFTSILFGAGVFRQGVGTPKTPNEVEREAAQGNGEGVETLWNRRHEVIHPTGFAVAGTQVSSNATPTYSALATASNWNRVFDRKNVPMAFIRTNG
ncbi:hypothetical protein [uncultured Brevundimonas sp.]|uniref:hypothetical protein n=1 Tax=uncultured Brevundimonas sp. TaxID=213418 RepID=UPI0025F9F935|nr:hypothetical protein [uncultured Brevundimonas sp.]